MWDMKLIDPVPLKPSRELNSAVYILRRLSQDTTGQVSHRPLSLKRTIKDERLRGMTNDSLEKFVRTTTVTIDLDVLIVISL